MKITFDSAKWKWTLRERGFDFDDALAVFAGSAFTFEDDRFDYPEVRFVTVGRLGGRMVVVVWTPEASVGGEEVRRVISMRKANVREQRRFAERLGEAGRDHR